MEYEIVKTDDNFEITVPQSKTVWINGIELPEGSYRCKSKKYLLSQGCYTKAQMIDFVNWCNAFYTCIKPGIWVPFIQHDWSPIAQTRLTTDNLHDKYVDTFI